MLFALVAHDRPGELKRRLDARPDHLKYLEQLGETVMLAGPFLDTEGNMVGSIVVIEAADRDAAQAIFDADPFVVAGVFDSVTIKPWRLGINNTKR